MKMRNRWSVHKSAPFKTVVVYIHECNNSFLKLSYKLLNGLYLWDEYRVYKRLLLFIFIYVLILGVKSIQILADK